MLTLERIRAQDWAEQLREEWCALAADSRSVTPFQTWEWVSAWWAHYSGTRRPYVLTVRDGKDLVGIAPLYLTRFPWRALRTMGTGQSDYLHPLARTGYDQLVSESLTNHLLHTKGVDLIDLHQVRETHPLAGLATRKITRVQSKCCVLDLPNSYDAYLKTLSKSLRYDVKRLDKAPFTNGSTRIWTARTEQESERALDVFLALHSARWRRRSLPGAFALPRVKRFQRDYVGRATQAGTLRMSVLESEGQPIGAIYAMQAGKRCFFYQSGFDPAANALSPGTVLVAHTIKMAIEEGAEQFDFLRGDEPYKLRWKPQHTLRNVRLMWKLNPLAGSAGETMNHMGTKVEGALRRRLEGKGLLS